LSSKKDIRSLNEDELKEVLSSNSFKSFRAKQIFHWIWNKSAHSFDEMLNLPKDLIIFLKENFVINFVKVHRMQKSLDGTIKNAIKLFDGHIVECVLIPTKSRITACVSSQVGCSLNCKFCATAKLKRMRNLNPDEIYDQVVLINQQAKEHFDRPLTNIVFMGMGEPLMNTENVLKTIQIMQDQKCYSLSKRRITLSTSGIVPEIEAITGKTDVSLAISLHASNDDLRNKIVPINKKYPIKDLLDSSKRYLNSLNSKSHITIEYILINDVNDSIEDASNLVNLLSDLKCKINLIPFNPFPESDYERSTDEKVKAFKDYLIEHNFIATVRVTRGDEIDGACGQLVGKLINPIGSKKLKNKQIAAQNLH